jgi:hypothetical protein
MLRSDILALALLAAGASPAAATWLHCAATGGNATGAIAYYSTVADVGPLPPARLAQLKQRMLSYATKADPEARGLRADCFTFDDETVANAHYSPLLNSGARRLGWDHVTVVEPESWLADGDIVDDPLRP